MQKLRTIFGLSVLTLVFALMFGATPAQAQFGTVTYGPQTPGSACASAPTLSMDINNNVVYSCGNDHVLRIVQKPIAVLGAQTALTTVTTAQTMWTVNLGANFANVVDRHLRLCGSAIFSNGATAPAITVSVKIGSSVTPVAVTTAANANSNTNAPIRFCFDIKTATAGATGNDEAHGWLVDATSAAWSAGTAASVFMDGNTAVSSNYDHTAANAVQVQIAATAALTSVTPRLLTVELVN